MKPCILVTNDDGIRSPGLRAAVAALAPLGDLVVVAPLAQYSGAGRSFAQGSRGRVEPIEIAWAGGSVQAYGLDGPPLPGGAASFYVLGPSFASGGQE